VHDSRVRRITAITPDMVRPKPHDSTPGARRMIRQRRSRIERQYPHRELGGKSPDRERKPQRKKMRD
jgi:hypothetical protein